MKKWKKPELLDVLRETLRHIEASEDSVWSELDVKEIAHKLSVAIEKLEHGKSPSKTGLSYLFLPTAPLQETAMENGWAEEYMELSSRFDKVAEKWG